MLARLELYFSPDLFVIGGGVSKNYAKFGGYLHTERSKIVPAQLLNEAGIVGAAMAAKDLVKAEPPPKKATRTNGASFPGFTLSFSSGSSWTASVRL